MTQTTRIRNRRSALTTFVKFSVATFIFLLASTFYTAEAAVQQVLNEPFDNDSQITITTADGVFFSDGFGDYLTLTDGSTIGSFIQLTGFDGQFLGAHDLDGEGGPNPITLEWQNLDITGLTSLSFSGLFAEDDDGTNQDWDDSDFVLFEYSIDGGSYSNLLAFEAEGGTNSEPKEDTNFNGFGDGTALTDGAQLFSKSIAGTGNSLTLRLTISLGSGDEDIAMDSLLITGDDGAASTNLAIAADDAAKAEGNASTTPFTFTVTRSGDTSGATDVDYAVTSASADAADFGGSLPSGTVNFAATDTVQTVTIDVSGDTDFEADEAFTVTLSNATGGATITTAAAEGTIQNDDAAPPIQLIITEIMYNPDSAEDGWEWVEVYNPGPTPVDLTGFVLDDDDGSVPLSANITSGTVPAGGSAVFYNADDVLAADFGAAWGTVNLVPVPNWSSTSLSNGGDRISIWSSFADYSSDDITAPANALDTVFYDDSGDWPTDSPDGPSIYLTDLMADNNVGTNWARSMDGVTTPVFDGYTSSNAGGNNGEDVGSPGTPPPPTVYINELRINLTGGSAAQVDFFEIQGDPSTDLTGLTYIAMSGEFNPGQIDAAISLDGQTIPADGLFWADGAGNASADFATTFDFFGSPQTHLIVSNFTGSAGTDYDTDNDGILDSTPWGVVIDSVSLVDGDATADVNYSATVVGPDGNFVPAGAFRCGDAPIGLFDTANTLSFFNTDDDTPGTTNAPSCPAPGAEVKIHEIQGSSDSHLLDGDTVIVEAIVVGDFQDGDGDSSRDLRGFYIQEEDADADGNLLTSEGIFVFEGGDTTTDIAVGDLVKVVGDVGDFFGETQLSSVQSITVISSNNPLPTAAVIDLPSAGTSTNQDGDLQPDLEAFEGMRVTLADTMTIVEMFNLDRFNEIKLSEGGRIAQYTQLNTPSVAGLAAHQEDVAKRTIVYDDGLGQQNALIGNLDGFGPTFNTATDIRMGDTIDDLSGVLSYQWAGNSASQATWRIRAATNGENTFTKANIRPTTPDDVGGTFKVASFNVLNYFTGIDGSGSICGPTGTDDCRGADSTTEFTRQKAKIAEAICTMDADVVGLVELENNGATAINDLVATINGVCGAGTYSALNTGTIGSDAITVGYIYKPATASLSGSFAILDSSIDSTFNDDKNRPALAQTFESVVTGEKVTIAVNHLKSKGSACDDVGDPDPGDGSGNCNGVRTAAAGALASWLATDPTSSGDSDYLIIGDLNAYAEETPITTLEAGGYSDLVQLFNGSSSYSFVFDGQSGSLDYALANGSLLSQVTGTTVWNINADEPDAIDYNLDFGRDASIFDGSVPFRSSDHDPIIVGLDLSPKEWTFSNELGSYVSGSSTQIQVTGTGSNFESQFWRTDENTFGSGNKITLDFYVDSLDTKTNLGMVREGGSFEGIYISESNNGLEALIYRPNESNPFTTVPLLSSSEFQANTWYTVSFTIDDINGFLIEVEQRDNPSINGVYRDSDQLLPTGEQWSIRGFIIENSIFVDNYLEEEVTIPDDWFFSNNFGSYVPGSSSQIQVTGTGVELESYFLRKDLSSFGDGNRVSFDFYVDQTSSKTYLGLWKAGSQSEGIAITDNGNGLMVILILPSQPNVILPLLTPGDFQANTWYSVSLTVDDVNGTLVEVEDRDNPAINGSYQDTSGLLGTGLQWRFAGVIMQDTVFVDNYLEEQIP